LIDVDMRSAIHLHQDIQQHINIEENMIRNLEKLKESVNESRVIEILDYIISDERRHHSLLQRLSNIIDSDVVAYDEYLSLILKYMVSSPK
jgi:rubrerythrin